MEIEEEQYILCSQEGCNKKIKNHRWVRVQAEGWHFPRTIDTARCPAHVPEWLDEWKKKQR